MSGGFSRAAGNRFLMVPVTATDNRPGPAGRPPVRPVPRPSAGAPYDPQFPRRPRRGAPTTALPTPHVRTISLALLLGALWAGMSGHGEALIIGLGVAAVVLSVWLARRMGLVDREGIPLDTLPRVPLYWLWLGKEVVKANLAVGRSVLSPDPGLEPSVLEVPDGQGSDFGRALYGNSITLTPGTVTLETDGRVMRVHALTRAAADDLRSGEMAKRTASVDGAGGAA